MMRASIVPEDVGRTIVISDAPSEGWHVSFIPADRPQAKDMWFARRDCALAFADGMAAAVPTWRVIDESTSRSAEVERAKADALAQFDLFMTDSRSP